MVIFYAQMRTPINEVWAGKTVCPYCKQVSDFHLKRIRFRLLLFYFLPIISCTEKRYLECDNCKGVEVLKRRKYKEIYARQMEKLENNQIPLEVVRQDYAPKALNMWWRWTKLALFSLFALFLLVTATVMSYEAQNIGALLSVASTFAVLGTLPLYFALNDFIETRRKQKGYNEALALLNRGSILSKSTDEPEDIMDTTGTSKRKLRLSQIISLVLVFVFLALPLSAFAAGWIEMPVTEVINKDGVLCDIDISTKGEILADAEPLSSKVIVLDGIKYYMALNISELISYGWELEAPKAYENQIFLNHVVLSESGYYEGDKYLRANMLVNDNGVEIDMKAVYNSYGTYFLTSCTVTQMTISFTDDAYKAPSDFILPGGITANSTAADVIKVYGNPNKSKKFLHSESTEDSFKYSSQDESSITYEFKFNEDGSLKQVEIIIPSSMTSRLFAPLPEPYCPEHDNEQYEYREPTYTEAGCEILICKKCSHRTRKELPKLEAVQLALVLKATDEYYDESLGYTEESWREAFAKRRSIVFDIQIKNLTDRDITTVRGALILKVGSYTITLNCDFEEVMIAAGETVLLKSWGLEYNPNSTSLYSNVSAYNALYAASLKEIQVTFNEKEIVYSTQP